MVDKIEFLRATSEQHGISYRTLKRPDVGVTEMVEKANTFSVRGKRVRDIVTGYQFAD
jgi:hypothetical protein